MAKHTTTEGDPIALDVRRAQLANLVETLHDVLRIIRHDPACPWREHFELSLAGAESLLQRRFTQEQLNSFSSSVCSAYDLSRCLAEYQPPPTVPNHANYQTYRSVAYERALELRAV